MLTLRGLLVYRHRDRIGSAIRSPGHPTTIPHTSLLGAHGIGVAGRRGPADELGLFCASVLPRQRSEWPDPGSASAPPLRGSYQELLAHRRRAADSASGSRCGRHARQALWAARWRYLEGCDRTGAEVGTWWPQGLKKQRRLPIIETDADSINVPPHHRGIARRSVGCRENKVVGKGQWS